MALTLQQKRALVVGLGILAAVALVNIAWAQIAHAVTQCFSPF
jgi:molybdopterin/thiamine biosynthesis adenylyltransferase